MACFYLSRSGEWRMSLFANEPRLPRRSRPRCGAKTRKGTPCQAPVVWDKPRDRPRNGRCKLHGGLSTGPKTEEGRRRIAEATAVRNRARRPRDGGLFLLQRLEALSDEELLAIVERGRG